MNWKEEAVERLERYSTMHRAVLTIPQELKRLEMEAISLRGGMIGSVGGCLGRGLQEDMLLNNMVKRQELRKALEDANLFIKITDQALSSLQPQEQQLLEQLYISPKWGNVNQMILETGTAKATLYKKRDRALKRFALSLFGKS